MTVGIVLISHSRALAEGAADVALQVCGGDVRVVGIGGTDDGRLGTDMAALVAAVEKVDGGQGVVIVPDLGSSVLTARTYLLDRPGSALLADAPFVEGAVSAAVAASTGASAAEVCAAAEEARRVRKL